MVETQTYTNVPVDNLTRIMRNCIRGYDEILKGEGESVSRFNGRGEVNFSTEIYTSGRRGKITVTAKTGNIKRNKRIISAIDKRVSRFLD